MKPTLYRAQAMVEEILLGDNPFIGVSHLAHSKAREDSKLGVETFAEVVIEAYRSGATGFTFSTHPTDLEILKVVRERAPEVLESLSYYPLVPYGMAYVRRSNLIGLPGLGLEILKSSLRRLGRLGWILKAGVRLDPSVVLALMLEHDLKPFLEVIPRGRVRAVLIHEVLTEVLIAHDAPHAFREFSGFFKDTLGVPVGFETRNICKLLQFAEKHDIKVPYVMTPLNKLGYQMAPSRTEAEKCIEELSTNSRVIAINILASGALTLHEALGYLKKFKVYAIAAGTSKPWRAREIFKTLSVLR